MVGESLPKAGDRLLKLEPRWVRRHPQLFGRMYICGGVCLLVSSLLFFHSTERTVPAGPSPWRRSLATAARSPSCRPLVADQLSGSGSRRRGAHRSDGRMIRRITGRGAC